VKGKVSIVVDSENKQKTTIVVSKDIWRRFLLFVVQKHGTARKISLELESVLEEYMATRLRGK